MIIEEWQKSGKHLPKIMRDFHDQKDIFKDMHRLYESEENESETSPGMPTWVKGHIYVVDWFLWYMARRGYTLQKTRKKLPFEGM